MHQFCSLYASDALCTKYQLGKNTNMVESAHEITAVLFSKYRYSATGVDLDTAAYCCGLMVNHGGVAAAELVLRELGVPDSAGRALGLRRWEYRRMQGHAQRNSPEAIAQRKQLRSARVLDSAANKRGRPAYNAHHDPALGAPTQRRKFDLTAAKEKMASYSASSSSSSNPSPRPRGGYSGARDVRCELCVDTACAGGASSAAYAAVGEGDDADDEAPAAAASGKRSRAPLLVGCFFCCRVRCIKHATGGDARLYPPDCARFWQIKVSARCVVV